MSSWYIFDRRNSKTSILTWWSQQYTKLIVVKLNVVFDSVLYCIILCYIILYHTILYYIILYYIISCFIIQSISLYIHYIWNKKQNIGGVYDGMRLLIFCTVTLPYCLLYTLKIVVKVCKSYNGTGSYLPNVGVSKVILCIRFIFKCFFLLELKPVKNLGDGEIKKI